MTVGSVLLSNGGTVRAFADMDMLISKDGRQYSVVEFKDYFDPRVWHPALKPGAFSDFVRGDFPWFDGRSKLGRELLRWYRAEFLKLEW